LSVYSSYITVLDHFLNLYEDPQKSMGGKGALNNVIISKGKNFDSSSSQRGFGRS